MIHPYEVVNVSSPNITHLPVSLLEVKKHCNLPLEESFTEQDSLLTTYINAAISIIENHGYIIRSRSCKVLSSCKNLYLSGNVYSLRIERVPTTAISSLTFYSYDDTGFDDTNLVTVNPSLYRLQSETTPPELYIAQESVGNLGFSKKRDYQVIANITCGQSIPNGNTLEGVTPATTKLVIYNLVAYMLLQKEGMSDRMVSNIPWGIEYHLQTIGWRVY